jgi:hypothetical protein
MQSNSNIVAYMKIRAFILIFLLLPLTSFSKSIYVEDDVSFLRVFNKLGLPLPPGDWRIDWQNDFDFCNPNDRARCAGTDGRALVLSNQSPNESPFYAVVVRHTNRGVNNWSVGHCYSRNHHSFFDNHGTRESMTFNKCSLGEYFSPGRSLSSSHWWWAPLKAGTDLIKPLDESAVGFEIVLQDNGMPRYQINVLVKSKFKGVTFSNAQLEEWKSRYVDYLASRLFNKKLNSEFAGLSIKAGEIVEAPSPLEAYFASKVQHEQLTTLTQSSSFEDKEPKPHANFFDAEFWSSPVELDRQFTYSAIQRLGDDATHFIIDELTPIVAPASGNVVYLGQTKPDETGFVIHHGANVFSVISSKIPWNLRYGITLGDPVDRGQFLTSASFSQMAQSATVSWHLFRPKTKTKQFDEAWVRALFDSPALNTRFVSRTGTLIVRGADQLPSGAVLKLNDTVLKKEHLQDAALLVPEDTYSFYIIYGGLFKTTQISHLTTSSESTVVKNLRKSGDGQWVADERSDSSVRLESTQRIIKELLAEAGGGTAGKGVVAPEPMVAPSRNSSQEPTPSSRSNAVAKTPIPSDSPIKTQQDVPKPLPAQVSPDRTKNTLAAEKAKADKLAQEREQSKQLAAEKAAKAKANQQAAEKAKADRLVEEKRKAEQAAADKAKAQQIAQEKAKIKEKLDQLDSGQKKPKPKPDVSDLDDWLKNKSTK